MWDTSHPSDIVPQGDSLTEQEHKDSCDVNKMILNAMRGLEIRGSSNQNQYGYDDTTMDAVQFRIQKEQLETELSATAQANEFSEDELKHIPKDVQTKFKFRKKGAKLDQPLNNEPNNEKTGPTPKAPTPTLDPATAPKKD